MSADQVDPILARYVAQAERFEHADFAATLRELFDALNAGGKHLPAALLSARSERAESWWRTFGRLWVPVTSDMPHWGRRPDGTRALFYAGDMARLTREQIRRVIADRAELTGMSARDVEATLRDPEHGLPILADDVLSIGELPELLDYLASC